MLKVHKRIRSVRRCTVGNKMHCSRVRLVWSHSTTERGLDWLHKSFWCALTGIYGIAGVCSIFISVSTTYMYTELFHSTGIFSRSMNTANLHTKKEKKKTTEWHSSAESGLLCLTNTRNFIIADHHLTWFHFFDIHAEWWSWVRMLKVQNHSTKYWT